MKQSKSFTIIELLVVIAIITILAALLLPALNRAKEQVRAIRCINNERQIGIAFISYIDTYNGYMPPDGDIYKNGTTTRNKDCLWLTLLNGCSAVSYPVKNDGSNVAMWLIPKFQESIYYCTSAYMRHFPQNTWTYPQQSSYGYFMGYSTSTELRKSNRLRMPSATGAISETYNCRDGESRVSCFLDFPKSLGGYFDVSRSLAPWHGGKADQFRPTAYATGPFPRQGKANILFLDGHVAGASWDEILQSRYFVSK